MVFLFTSLRIIISKHSFSMSKLDRSTHTLNNSTSKMTYSFPKASRFLPTLKPTYSHFKAGVTYFTMCQRRETEELLVLVWAANSPFQSIHTRLRLEPIPNPAISTLITKGEVSVLAMGDK